MAVPAAVFEVLVYLCLVGMGTLCFLLGWMTPEGAGVLTVLLLASLLVLAWNRFDQGRHPCFLFLCTLMFFQGGGLLAYCLGAEDDPLRVQIMTPNPFYVSRDTIGIVLLSLALSAICVYAPCRWNYQKLPPPDYVEVRRYLPYLYLVFFATLPVQLLKNYLYYQYALENGGYTSIFLYHSAMVANVPLLARLLAALTLPAFVAIFVFEHRKKQLFVVTFLYFLTASLILLLGSRAAAFTLVLALWYVARIKSMKKARIIKLAAFLLILLMLGDAVSKLRGGEEVGTTFSLLRVLEAQGGSLNVTEVAVKYRNLFSPHTASYLLTELGEAFVATDVTGHHRGSAVADDVSQFLNPSLFALGYGTGGSYVGEAYIVGGFAGVIVISVLIGSGLHVAYRLSENGVSLLLVALVLPYVLVMPRGGLLDWLSVLARNIATILALAVGWKLFCGLAWLGQTYRAGSTSLQKG